MSVCSYNGKIPEIEEFVYIHESAVIIGDVTLDKHVSIWPTVVIRGDVQTVTIGAGTNVQDGSILHVTHDSKYAAGGFPLSIGQGVTIGHRAVVHACKVGDYCLIGIGAIIMDGAELEDYIMLGAGALVTPGKKLESGYLYVGSPAKKVRPLDEEEKRFLEYSYQHYIQLKDEYLRHS